MLAPDTYNRLVNQLDIQVAPLPFQHTIYKGQSREVLEGRVAGAGCKCVGQVTYSDIEERSPGEGRIEQFSPVGNCSERSTSVFCRPGV